MSDSRPAILLKHGCGHEAPWAPIRACTGVKVGVKQSLVAKVRMNFLVHLASLPWFCWVAPSNCSMSLLKWSCELWLEERVSVLNLSFRELCIQAPVAARMCSSTDSMSSPSNMRNYDSDDKPVRLVLAYFFDVSEFLLQTSMYA